MPHATTKLSSLPEYIRGLEGLGKRTALVEQHLYRSRSYSFGELIGRAFAFTEALQARGVRAGDRVMIWGASGGAWAVAFYGCVLAGAVVVPLDAAFSRELAERVRQQTEAVLLCSDQPGLPATASITFEEILALPQAAATPAGAPPPPDTLLEIVYTSGATADPKGVMITHGNILANLRPIGAEVEKHFARARLLMPLRFLHLIPLSHLFGQVMGLLIPPLIESAVVFPESQAPAQWAAIIRRYRASVMVAVPQQLTLFSQWAAAALGIAPEQAVTIGTGKSIPWRWWRWRKLHRRLGWKMWAFVVGGASLAPKLEDFWNALGYAVIQGYGLTETAPAIAITHPFKVRRGSVGRAVAGVETRIAVDGEILVRGGNVSPGYYRNPTATQAAFADGWLHTGDLGKLDDEGNLIFLGRKKEVIVTAAGLNVYPDDVEQVLGQQAAIEDCAVVEDQRQGAAQVHAVAVLRAGQDAGALQAAVAAANARLEPHQRISAASIWPRPHLPRTTSTHKLQRTAMARWVNQGQAPDTPADGDGDWKRFVERRWGIAASRLQPGARLDGELGLSSLDRVELWSWLDAHAPGGLEEAALITAQTVGDVDALVAPQATQAALPGPRPPTAPATAVVVPPDETTWTLRPSLRRFRTLAQYGLIFPVFRTVTTRIRVEGAEHLENLRRPVLFIANHQSMLDVPLILWALPRRWRAWLAPAMGAEPYLGVFDPHAPGWRRWRDRWRLSSTRLFFNGYLLSALGAVATTLRHTGRLADQGFCPIIFPEGRRTPDGQIHAFRPGIGVFAATLRLPVVPIRIDGLYKILPDWAWWPRPGRASVQFGPVMEFQNETPDEITAKLESWFTIRK